MTETLSEFLKRFARGTHPCALILTGRQPSRDSSETISSLLTGSFFLDAEGLSAEELEAFFIKRIQEEGLAVVPISGKSPEQLIGYLDTLLEQNRFQAMGASGWETIVPHRKFKAVLVADEQAVQAFPHLLRKSRFPYRFQMSRHLESV